MTANSKIEWTDHTFNPWVGCTKVSPGCDHCYAESWAKRTGNSNLWTGARRRTTAQNWRQPLSWNALAKEYGRRPRVFCASLADVFDNAVPEEWRIDLFKLIRQCDQLDWLMLTKRIGNAGAMLNSAAAAALNHSPGTQSWGRDPWPNVWLGATVVNQEEADRDIPKLLATPAHVRFLSCEPLLGPINLERIEIGDHRHPLGTWCAPLTGCFTDSPTISWVIVGGESGGNARRMEVAWATRIRAQCKDARVPFFMKQGSAANWPEFKNFSSFLPVLQVREWPR